MKICIGSDHGGFNLKEEVVNYLKNEGYDVLDVGCFSTESVDYPVYAKDVCKNVLNGYDFGVIICTTGEGVSMVANKYEGIRAALVYNEDVSKLARQHNNANVICMGARFTPFETAKIYLDNFLKTQFEGGRHERRVNMINNK